MTNFQIDIIFYVSTQNQFQQKMDINSINVIRWDFTKHLMQHLSHHFSPHLRKNTCKGKLPITNSKRRIAGNLRMFQN